MLPGFRIWLLLVSAALCAGLPEADATEGWSIYIDNDKLAPRGTDRDYTGSFAISHAAPANEPLPLSLDKAVDLFDGGRDESGALHMHGFEFGVVAFTPANITIAEPQPDDRPYASLTYITGKRHRVDVLDNSSFARSLTLGILGVRAVSNIQREIHDVLKSTAPRGWDNQISDGGELTFRYLWEYRQLQGDYLYENGRRLQWATATGFSVGYLTEGIIGLNLRYGHLTDAWWSFHSSPTGFGDRMLSTAGQYGNGPGWYVWASASASLRFYNAFLEGQFRGSEVTYDNDRLRAGTGHFSAGVGWTFNNRWRLNYYVKTQASEVESGLGDRAFTWGGIVLQVPVD